MTQQMFILNDVNGELSGYNNQLVQRRGERGGRIQTCAGERNEVVSKGEWGIGL